MRLGDPTQIQIAGHHLYVASGHRMGGSGPATVFDALKEGGVRLNSQYSVCGEAVAL